jgi:hypothetical protein
VRLGSLRPKSGPSGGVAARYRAADNTMGVGFVDPRKRVAAPSYQTVRDLLMGRMDTDDSMQVWSLYVWLRQQAMLVGAENCHGMLNSPYHPI